MGEGTDIAAIIKQFTEYLTMAINAIMEFLSNFTKKEDKE